MAMAKGTVLIGSVKYLRKHRAEAVKVPPQARRRPPMGRDMTPHTRKSSHNAAWMSYPLMGWQPERDEKTPVILPPSRRPATYTSACPAQESVATLRPGEHRCTPTETLR